MLASHFDHETATDLYLDTWSLDALEQREESEAQHLLCGRVAGVKLWHSLASASFLGSQDIRIMT